MKRSSLVAWSGVALVLVVLASAFSQNPSPAELRSKSQQAMKNGNWKDAYEGFRKLSLDPKNDVKQAGTDLQSGVQCLNRLGRTAEVDEFLESAIAAQQGNWRLLQAAAQQYANNQHQGFIIAGKFERGHHRGGGKFVNSVERDRVRAMQLFAQAMPLANQDDDKPAVGQFYLQFAEIMLNNRGFFEAWRLQSLANLKELPDFDEGGHGFRQYNGAPVDAEGNPVYHYASKTWEEAKTDGERWRWLLDQAVENHPAIKLQVKMQMAGFWQQMFGVESLQHGNWGGFFNRPLDDDTKQNESGTWELHTLKDDETIAKLASGIKRFTLPDEFNALKLYKEVSVGANEGGFAERATEQLAQVYENRRQYSQAAVVWEDLIKRFAPGQNDYRKQRLDQIVGNWGQFEATSTQPAGSGATIDFRFRNGKKVKFEARPIKVDLLLSDVKEYLKSDPGNRVDWNKINLQNIGYRLVHENEVKYLAEGTAGWELELEPRENHFDKRITVTTPLQKAGAYLLTGTMENGNVSKVVLWVADTAIVKHTLHGKNLYFVADAENGTPIAKANLEFFGWQQRHLGGNRFQVTTTNFAEETSADGLVIPDPRDLKTDFNWLVTVRGDKTRFAFLGFQNVWDGRHFDAEYNEVKVFGMTDRPVYRPNQKVEFKFWVRHTKYDQPDTSDFAKKSFLVEIRNPKGDVVYSKPLETDEFAGMSDAFPLPTDATLGQYHFSVTDVPKTTGYNVGGNYFRVEEYKKPEYEVKIEAPTEPVMLGEKITAKIEAKYYFGSPVTKGTVKYKVLRSDFSQDWFPVGRWDWCYEPGYWWFTYDYPWYKGFNNWVGCMRPMPWWIWRGQQQPPELIAEVEQEIGEDGKLEFEIDTSLAKEMHANTDHKYTITAEVRDESRRTIVGSGQVLVARKPFKVFTWVDRGYYRVGDTVNANFLAQTLDSKPVEGTGTLKLLKITYDKDLQPIETPVQEWKVNTNDEGKAEQKLDASRAGQYRLSYTLTDKKEHTIEGGYIFTIVGPGYDGREFRFNALELIPDKKEYAPGETVKLQLNADHADGTVLLFIRPANGVYLEPKVLRLTGKSAVQEIEVVKRDMPNFFIEAVTVAGGRVHTQTKEVVVPPEKRILNVEVIPSKTEYKPGEKGKVKLKVTDSTGEGYAGTTVLTMYDKSVEYISGGSNVPEIKEFFWKWRRRHNPQHQDSLSMQNSFNMTLPNKPGMNFLGIFGAGVADEMANTDRLGGVVEKEMASRGRGMAGGFGGGLNQNRRMNALDEGAPMAAMAPMAKGEAGYAMMDAVGGEEQSLRKAFDKPGNANAGADGGAQNVEPTVRSNFADTAKWVATLNTGKDGLAEVDVDMPENLTAWKIRVWGLGHGTVVGSADVDVVTRKNLIVRLQAPRFFVQKDEVVLTANVHNYLDKEKDVTVVLEVPADKLEPTTDRTVLVKIPAGGEARVDWRCKVLNEGEINVRMKALTDEESDAMEMKLPSYVHGMLKTDSWAGTVRPDQQLGKLTILVPKERRVEQSVLEVRYSPSLAMAMVDALPFLTAYPYGCTEQTLNRFIPAVITQRTLTEMNLDLAAIKEKRTNLNAQEIGDAQERARQWKRFDINPVFDKAELDRMVKDGVKALTEMQISDGGWGWFSGAGERSHPHTTAVVVHGLQIAKANDVALVPGVLERGTDWLKTYQAEQVQRLKNFVEKKDVPNIPKKAHADALDALVYMILNDGGIDDGAMRDFLYRDRTTLPVYGKATFGLALHKVGDQEKLAMILQNISQFVVEDSENETAYLKLPPEQSWWNWFGDEVEANAYYLKLLSLTEPTKPRAPRLVKYLLNNRKHATYWKSTRDTALCVEAFAAYIKASGEQKPDMVVELWVDGKKQKEVEINADNLFTFDNKFVLTGGDVADGSHEIEIRRKGKGPVYFNAYLTNFTLEDNITKAGLEIKVERQYYKLVPVDKTIDAQGSRGQVVGQKVEKYERQLLKNLDTLKSGDLVEIELVIESKNDYEYIMFEDMKAAGFEPVDVKSGHSNNGLGAYMELRDNRVCFFVRQLMRGKHSLAYRMRAEIPGQFAALPTKASAMYAPELRGNSDEIKLKIVD